MPHVEPHAMPHVTGARVRGLSRTPARCPRFLAVTDALLAAGVARAGLALLGLALLTPALAWAAGDATLTGALVGTDGGVDAKTLFAAGSNWNWAWAGASLVGALALVLLIQGVIQRVGLYFAKKTETELDDIIVVLVCNIIARLVLAAGAVLCVYFIAQRFEIAWWPILAPPAGNLWGIVHVAVVAGLGWVLSHYVNRRLRSFFQKIAGRTKSPVDDQVVDVVCTFCARLFLIAGVVLAVLYLARLASVPSPGVALGSGWNAVWGLLALVLSFMLSRLVMVALAASLLRLAKRSKTALDDLFVRVVCAVLARVAIAAGLCLGVGFVARAFGFDWQAFLGSVFTAALYVVGAAALWRLVDIVDHLLSRWSAKTQSTLDDQIVPMVTKALRLALVIVVAIGLIEQFGGSVAGIIAGLGVGGLALALAAQEGVSNIFGSLMIFADRPFEVGESIKVDGVAGTVTEVGIRSTRIRTYDKTEVIIPNKDIAHAHIENITRRPMRRNRYTLGVTYDATPEQVEAAVFTVRELLQAHPDVDDGPSVFFTGFGESALEISVSYWVKELNYARYMTLTQEINLDIMRKFAALGLDFAFPSRTLYVKDAANGANPGALAAAAKLAKRARDAADKSEAIPAPTAKKSAPAKAKKKKRGAPAGASKKKARSATKKKKKPARAKKARVTADDRIQIGPSDALSDDNDD